MGYSKLVKWIDWQAMKLGAPLAIVDPRGTSSECPQCGSKLEESGYRRLKRPSESCYVSYMANGIIKAFIISLIAMSPIPLISMLARSFASQIVLEVYSAIWWSSWDLCAGLYNLYLLLREKRASIFAVITLATNISAPISSLVGLVIAAMFSLYGAEITFMFSPYQG